MRNTASLSGFLGKAEGTTSKTLRLWDFKVDKAILSFRFNTCAFYNDFTTAIPNTVGTGLPSNWLTCDQRATPAVCYWVPRQYTSGTPCRAVESLRQPTRHITTGAPRSNVQHRSSTGEPKRQYRITFYCRSIANTSFPAAYFEITFWNNQTIAGMADAFWSWEPSGQPTGDFLEVDFIEDWGSGGALSGADSGTVCWWSTCNRNSCTARLDGQFDRTQHNTFGGLLTGDGNGNWSYCTYLNGNRIACKQDNPAAYPADCSVWFSKILINQ